MGALEIDLEIIKEINRRFLIKTVAYVVMLVGIIVELGLVFYFTISQGIPFTFDSFPLMIVIFAISAWLILVLLLYQMMDIRNGEGSVNIDIKNRFNKVIKSRSRKFLIIFIALLFTSVIIGAVGNHSFSEEFNIGTGQVHYFSGSSFFGAQTVYSIGIAGNGNVLIYQNGSSIPLYQISVSGWFQINQTLQPGYYWIKASTGNFVVHLYKSADILNFIVSVSSSIGGIIEATVIPIIGSNRINNVSRATNNS